MTGDLWSRNEVDSPCLNICAMHPDAKICVGCHRTIAEISGWSAMSDQERSAIRADLPERAHMLKKRRGGRAARRSEIKP